MPINNKAGLEALRALSQGGTPALDAYNKARGAETASRTSALDKALGGQDLGAAVAKAQAQYAPKVATPGLSVNDLNPAAENYLSRASEKLATQQYTDQQNLAIQAEALRRKENELTAEERQAQLLGAAELMGQKQLADAQQNTTLGQGLDTLAVRKANLRNQLTEFDKTNNIIARGGAVTPEEAMQVNAQRQAILDQMGALDQQQAATAEQYARFLGTDTKGFQEAYAKADAGDTNAARDLVSYLRGEGVEKAALGRAQRDVQMGTQGRLRALAPAFGIDPLTAEGRFREGEGDDLQRQAQLAQQRAFISGEGGPQAQALTDKAGAQATGLELGDYVGLRDSTGLTDQEIVDTVQSPDWGPISEIANEYVGKDRTKNTGVAGFRKDVQNKLKDLVDDQGNPVSEDVKEKMLELAVGYYSGQIAGSKSEAATE